MVNVSFITLGCPKNEADTQLMSARIEASDYNLVADIDHADVVVVNTCAFIQSATEESIEVILDTARDWLNLDDKRHLLVAGCLPSRYQDELASELPEVSAFLKVVDESSLCATIETLTGVPANVDKHALSAYADGSFAYIKIADGCDKSCAFCTIPSIRGGYVSRPRADILNEIRSLSERGVSEFILIAQDTTRYGLDLTPADSLSSLIDAVCEIESVKRVRVMYLQPEGVSDELIATLARQPKVCHYIEMPLQHSSQRILRLMNRGGDGVAFSELIKRLRAAMPDVALRTTLIVGYPSETRQEFEDLCDFVREIEFDYVGVFPFSPEEGTAAAALSEQLDEDTKIKRYQELRDLADGIGWSKAAERVGQTLSVLIEGHEGSTVYGRTQYQAPDIDGIVRLSANGSERDVTIGSYEDAEIVDSILYDLDGRIECRYSKN